MNFIKNAALILSLATSPLVAMEDLSDDQSPQVSPRVSVAKEEVSEVSRWTILPEEVTLKIMHYAVSGEKSTARKTYLSFLLTDKNTHRIALDESFICPNLLTKMKFKEINQILGKNSMNLQEFFQTDPDPFLNTEKLSSLVDPINTWIERYGHVFLGNNFDLNWTRLEIDSNLKNQFFTQEQLTELRNVCCSSEIHYIHDTDSFKMRDPDERQKGILMIMDLRSRLLPFKKPDDSTYEGKDLFEFLAWEMADIKRMEAIRKNVFPFFSMSGFYVGFGATHHNFA